MLRLLRILAATFFETIRARLQHGRARPSWSFQFEWVVRFLRRDFLESGHWPYERLRRDLNSRRYPSSAVPKVRMTQRQLGGVPVVEFTPPEVRRKGVIVFFHGGSYIFGSALTSHADIIASLALRLGVRAVGPEYRLAPEHPYPAALEDASAVYAALLEEGCSADQIVLAGDSAGGNLALSLQLSLRDRHLPQAKAAALISPWLDLTASSPSCRINDAIDYGNTSFLLRHARDFAGSVPLTDPRVSPIHAELKGLAKLFVQAGDAERLIDECRELARLAVRSGVELELDIVPDMPHNPPVLAAFHPAAQRSLDRLAQFIGEQLPMDRADGTHPR